MKSASEWKTDTLTNPDEHKRRATTIRRLAGGLRSEIEGHRTSGLNDKEQKVLSQAVALLESMAANRDNARKDAAIRIAAHNRREKEIKAAMSGSFGKLVSVPDMVSLVAAVRSYDLREWGAKDLGDLKWYAAEALASLAYTLAKEAGPAAEVVAAAWEKFGRARAELEAKYRPIINKLAG